MATVLLTSRDVQRFAKASHDFSPLHVDATYARRTSFGQTVVHGVLVTLSAVARLAPHADAVTKLTVDFLGPVFEDTAYDVVVEDSGKKAKISVRDGGRVLLRASLVRGAGTPAELAAFDGSGPREGARADEVLVGPVVDAAYGPRGAELDAIMGELGLRARGLGSAAVSAMMAASYIVGMERPGAQALFARLQLAFPVDPVAAIAPARITAVLATIDERFAMATMDVDLCGAKGEIRALVRPRPVALEPARIDRAFAALGREHEASGRALDGKTAVVVGGGRGLGAAIALALAKCGARVIATYAGSRETADALAALDARIEVLQADATDATACARIALALGDRQVDVVVLSASPAVLPMSAGTATASRALGFVERSLAMALVPMAVLGDRSLAPGCKIVAISSSYVTEPPEDFAHYVAAKGALEGFLRGVAKDRGLPLVVARPPRVLTDMTNTPFGAEDAQRTEDVAARIAAATVDHAEGVVVVSDFATTESRAEP